MMCEHKQHEFPLGLIYTCAFVMKNSGINLIKAKPSMQSLNFSLIYLSEQHVVNNSTMKIFQMY